MRREETDGGDTFWGSAKILWSVGSCISVRRLRLSVFWHFDIFGISGFDISAILRTRS
jgi:hypothetical protein